MSAARMSAEELRLHLAAQNRLVRQLLEATEALLALNGPDAAQRRRMLELAHRVAAVGAPEADRLDAAKQLAQMVLRNISVPRPTGLPSTVDDVVTGGQRVS